MTKADKEGQRKTPILRFKGFTDDWEQRKLQNQVQFFSGLTYSPNDVKSVGTFVIRSSNIKDNTLVPADNVYVNPDIANSEPVKKDDVIMVVRNGSKSLIGKHALVTRKINNTVIGAFMTGIRSSTPYFLDALLDTVNFKKEIYKNLGATINQITVGNLRKMTFKVPNESEKFKIGNLFKKLNYLLALYERKTKLIKQIQSSFLDKFFFEPNNVTSLNHFLRIRNGYAFKSSELTENGEIPVVKISNIGNDKSFAFTTKEKNKEQFALYPNDIVIALSGATAGKINQVSNKYPIYYQNQRVGFFERKNDKLDYEYLNSFLHSKKFKSQLQKTLVAGAQPNIAPKDIEKIKIPFIGYKLQQKIGQVNKYLFELQRINKSKLTLLDKIKKTLLNNMFV